MKWSGFSENVSGKKAGEQMKRFLSRIFIGIIQISVWLVGADAQEMDIRDIRGPVEYPLDPVFVGLLFAAALILIIFLVWMIIKYRKAKPKTVRTKIQLPWELAIEQLNHLMENNYIETNKFDSFYMELSGILRSYLENNFSIRAPEMTTEEFLSSIRKNDILFGEQKEALKKFLLYADMVKFAKVNPSRKDVEDGYRLAKEFIEQTRKV